MRRGWRSLVGGITVLSIPLVILTALRLGLALWPWPELDSWMAEGYSPGVLDRQGRLMALIPLDEGLYREYTPLEELPEYLKQAFIQGEDRRYWYHPGVDILAVLRALVQNWTAQASVSGASTITMQVAKMIQPQPPGPWTKPGEALNALRLESRFSKEKILELYLNHVPFGGRAEGVTSGARLFFGRPPQDLRPEEVCVLAAAPRNPTRFNPVSNLEGAVEGALRFAAAAGLDKSWSLDLSPEKFRDQLRPGTQRGPKEAPHFVRQIEALTLGRPKIKTTLDLSLQRSAEEILDRFLRGREGERLVTGAVLVVDNRTGEVLAYVGSRDFLDDKNRGQIDGVRIKNQPGSTLKPFLYAQALEQGFGPQTILPDIPMDFGQDQVYVPLNFNNKYNGPVRLRVALASSLNIPAVYLLQRLGVQNFVQTLTNLGFSHLEKQKDDLGVGMALGNVEVTLWDLTRAFTVFSQGGLLRPLVMLMDSPDRNKSPIPVFRPQTAWLIADILSDEKSRYTGFGQSEVLATPYGAMFKTGTANQFQHVWALGATSTHTVGVWMGNFTGETIIGRSGSGLPARVARSLLDTLVESQSSQFLSPPGMKKMSICTLSGEVASSHCPSTTQEYLTAESDETLCTWHTPDSGVFYPPEYASWKESRGHSGSLQALDSTPWEIIYPANESIFYLDPRVPLWQQGIGLKLSHPPELTWQARLNSEAVQSPSSQSKILLPLKLGENILEITGSDGTYLRHRYWVR